MPTPKIRRSEGTLRATRDGRGHTGVALVAARAANASHCHRARAPRRRQPRRGDNTTAVSVVVGCAPPPLRAPAHRMRDVTERVRLAQEGMTITLDSTSRIFLFV